MMTSHRARWRTASLLTPLLLLGVLLLAGCSARKNTAATRRYQEFITRYNVHYNGDEHFKQTLKEMERNYEDDYQRTTIFMHPVEAKGVDKAPQPQGSFDRSIEKAQKAIQLRSIKARPKKQSGRNNDPEYREWMRRSEYNPFLHNSWMMMARSQYYNGDFAGAAATFMYITKNFTWLPDVVTEARIWEARSYCALDWLYEAETTLARVKEDMLTNNTLRELYYFTAADIDIRRRNGYARAIPLLEKAIGYARGPQKTRLNFLLGQLYAAEGNKEQAYQAFKRAGGSSSASYRTKFNARIKQSEVYAGADIEPEVRALRRMTRYDRNKEYLDQIYYAIGNLYLSRGDTVHAIENYVLAADKSTRSGIEKAIAELTLGRIYFEQGRYDLAQPRYAGAVPLLAEDYPDYKQIKLRSDVLDELAVYSQNVTLQDSLLHLASLPEDELLAVIDKMIADLVKKEREEAEAARREEYLAQQEGANPMQGGAAGAPSQFQLNTDDSWYFYNTAARNAGKTDFQRRWGSRRLEDNWRRRNKAVFDISDFDNDLDEENDSIPLDDEGEPVPPDSVAADEERANDPHNREYYLKQIPFTDDEKVIAGDVIQEGLYNMGVILKNKLFDFDAAAAEFARLLNDYPDNIYRLDAYYNLYLLWMQAGNPERAEEYRQLILKEFPESPYGQAMRDPRYLDNLRAMEATQNAMYAQAYEAYLDNRNADVHRAYDEMMSRYPMSPLMPRFMFLDALSYVTEQRPDEFAAVLRQLLERYPQAEIASLASSYLKGVTSGRQLNMEAGSGNTRGMLWDTRLWSATDSTGAPLDTAAIAFTRNADAPHALVLLYRLGADAAVNPNLLLFQVARYNFNAFRVADYDLDQRAFPPLGMLTIAPFDNEAAARQYRALLQADTIITATIRPVVISRANLELMLTRGATFEQYFEYMGEATTLETHEAVLPPDEYPSQQEMYAAPEPEPMPAPAPPAPAPTPAPKPQPAPVPQPPLGSEGDDPLLDM